MKLTVHRGELRRTLSQIQPHMGQPAKKSESEEYHPYGRARFAVSSEDRIVMWAGDQYTRACASLPVVEYKDSEAPIFDLSVDDVALILRTFKPLGDADQKSMWLQGLFELSLTTERLTVTELLNFGLQGKSLTIPLWYQAESPVDTYPDFPSPIISVFAAPIEGALESYPYREGLFRILAAAHPHGILRLIESSRDALVIGGTTEFTAIVPAKLRRPPNSVPEPAPESFDAVIGMLLPFVQRIDESTEAGKARAALTRGFTISTEREKANTND